MDALLTILGVLAVLLVVAMIAVLVALALGLRTLRRRNRVSPSAPSPAPLTWLGSPAQVARLHRRLRSAVAVARMVQTRHARDVVPARVAELAAEIEQQAVGVDEQLAMVGRLTAPERKRLTTLLAAEVQRIEQLASRLQMLDVAAGAPAQIPHHPTAIQDLADQLDQLESAHRVVTQVEAEAGLTSPSPLPAATTPTNDPELRRRRG